MSACSLAPLLCLLALAGGEPSTSPKTGGDAVRTTLIEDLDYGNLPDISSDTVVVTFFYDSRSTGAADGHQLLKQLDRYFRGHPAVNVRLCKVSCTGQSGQFCRADLVNRAVHAFRQGHPRVTLSLAGSSPLDAVIATSLHLWLAERVAVLNTARELAELQLRCLGRCNILTAYFPSLGATEHRLLLEAALEEHTIGDSTDDAADRLQFAMTSSEEAVVELPPPLYQSFEDQTELLSPRLWMLLCLGDENEPSTAQKHCPTAGFHFELATDELQQFLKASTRPGWVMAPDPVSAQELPFDLRKVHVVLLLADSLNVERVATIAPALGRIFRGSVGFVVINLDLWPTEVLSEFGLNRQQLYLPSLAFIARGTETVSAVLNEYDDAIGFIKSQVIKYLKMVERRRREETDWDDLELELDTVPPVLKQDDEVELTLPGEDDFSTIRDIDAEEFSTLSRSSDFTVVVGYLPWDPMSRALLWELVTLPAALRRHLARLSCLDWSELCDQIGVRSHPYVMVLAGGHRRQVNGSLSGTAVTQLINNGAAPVPFPVDKASLKRWMDGKLTRSPLDGTDSVLLLPTGQRMPSAFSGRLRGETLIVQIDDKDMRDMFGKAAALCVKSKDPFQPTLEIDMSNLEQSISWCVPVMRQLDEESYHLLLPSRWTFLLFCPAHSCPVLVTEDGLTQAAGQLALTVPNCYWINSSSAVGRQVRQQYRLTSATGLVAVNLTSGHVVRYAGPASTAPLLQWADRVRGGHLTGQVLLKSEPWLPLLPPIDFSSAAGQAESAPEAEQDTVDAMDEFQGAADGPQSQRDEL